MSAVCVCVCVCNINRAKTAGSINFRLSSFAFSLSQDMNYAVDDLQVPLWGHNLWVCNPYPSRLSDNSQWSIYNWTGYISWLLTSKRNLKERSNRKETSRLHQFMWCNTAVVFSGQCWVPLLVNNKVHYSWHELVSGDSLTKWQTNVF
jgi:hypothetical protein